MSKEFLGKFGAKHLAQVRAYLLENLGKLAVELNRRSADVLHPRNP
jgi:hypothetical protein